MSLFGLFGPPDVEKHTAEGNIRGLIKATRYRYDWVLRRDALQALYDIATQTPDEPDERIVEAIIRTLRDGHWKIREMAAEFLGEIGNDEAIMRLLPTTTDEYVSVRRTAVVSLRRLLTREEAGTPPDKAVATLIRSLRDRAWWVREAAAETIEMLADRIEDAGLVKWAAEWLHAAVETDDYRIVRQAAIDAMIALGAPPTVDSLITALCDEAWSVRRSSAQALDALGWEPTKEHEVHYWIAKGECQRCVPMGHEAIGPLVNLLHDQYLPLQEGAIEALAAMGPPAVEDLLDMLQHRDYWTKAAAVETLGMIAQQHNSNSVPVAPLIEALEDRSKTVRRATARALGIIGDKQALEALLLLLNDHQATVRKEAAIALGKMGDRAAVQALMHLGRRDPDHDVRRAAQEALSDL
jgi:HEAT repeat protein